MNENLRNHQTYEPPSDRIKSERITLSKFNSEQKQEKSQDNQTKFIQTDDLLNFQDFTDMIKNNKQLLTRENISHLKTLINDKNSDNPIYIADLSKLVHQQLKWIQNLPTVKPYYAIKCNNNPEIIKTLIKLGCRFDCASKNEIKTILDLGVDSSRIIFANPCKPPSHLKYAYENKVDLMTFDGSEELEKIKFFHPNAKLVIRIRVDDSKSICQFGAKFGVHNGKTRILIEKISAMGMNLVGVSFHVGSGCGDPNAYYDAIKKSREIFDEAEEFGFKLTLLDIGGGFPGHEDGSIKFEHHAIVILK